MHAYALFGLLELMKFTAPYLTTPNLRQEAKGLLLYSYIFANSRILVNSYLYTDKKENQIFLICKEIRDGAVGIAKSYMTNGLLIYGEIFAQFLIC